MVQNDKKSNSSLTNIKNKFNKEVELQIHQVRTEIKKEQDKILSEFFKKFTKEQESK